MENIKGLIESLDVSKLEGGKLSEAIETESLSDQKAKFICDHIAKSKPRHILHDSLRKSGTMVQDSFEKYLSHDNVSSSILKTANQGDYHLRYLLSNTKEEKKYFTLGTFIHAAILEPTKFDRIAVLPSDVKMNSLAGVQCGIDYLMIIIKGLEDQENIEFMAGLHNQSFNPESLAGKKNYYKLLLEYSKIEVMDQKSFDAINEIKRNLSAYGGGIIKRLLLHSKREVSFYDDSENELPLKVRPDAIAFKENIGLDAIISVKSSSKNTLREFYSQCASLHYDLSEAMYQDVVSRCTGREFDTTLMIMVQTVAPYQVALLIWSPDDIATGYRKFENAKERYIKCITKGYQGLDSISEYKGIISFNLPDWNNA